MLRVQCELKQDRQFLKTGERDKNNNYQSVMVFNHGVAGNELSGDGEGCSGTLISSFKRGEKKTEKKTKCHSVMVTITE